MAGVERNMAEGTSGPGPEGPALYIANKSGTVTERRPIGPEQPIRPVSNVDINIDNMAAAIVRALDERQRLAQQQQRVERPWQGDSEFESTLRKIAQAEIMLATTPAEIAAKQSELQVAREARDSLLKKANDLGLFNFLKTELSGLYYKSRITVTNNEKEGRDEYEGHGRLQQLRSRRQTAYDPTLTLEADVTDERVGGRRRGYWTGRPDAAHLAQEYGGIIDYFHQTSMDLIYEVVRDRKRYTSDDIQNGVVQTYPPTGIAENWNGSVRDAGGRILKDEGAEIIAQNFDDFRAAIEERRRRMPWVPNRADYETYIRFVADDAEELEEMIPYIVARVRRKLGTGQPDKLSQRLEQEKEKIDNALTAFPEQLISSEREFRRLKSTLDDDLNLMGTYYFSEKIRDDWGPFLSYLGLLADATQDTEIQDHLVDALILDKDGLTMLAAHKFFEKDGIFWRYGQKSADLATEARNVNELFIWQKNKRQEIAEFLMGKRLRKMKDLLVNHPAFQRLKAEFDVWDKADRDHYDFIRDMNGQSTNKTRWQEYVRAASEWEKTGKYGDPRDPERVIFQHPLARSFKAPTKNADGQVESEFLDMFEDDNRLETDRWYASTKRRKVKSTMEKVERLCRALLLDSAAALAWHFCKTQEEVDEINEYLEAAGEDSITLTEAVPQKTLYRALMQACIREDKTKLPKDRSFKMYDLLTERLGLDLDLPTSAAWYLGWHDTQRPAVILKAIKEDNRSGGLKSSGVMPAPDMDEKNTGTSWMEKERRMGILMQMVMYGKFGRPWGEKFGRSLRSSRYFNWPGHDTPGAGVKDVRNYLNLIYGTSRDTVWLNDLLKEVGFPIEQEFPKDFGATRDPITQLVGLSKWGNEVVFAQNGYVGAVESPRDMKSWVKRTAENVEQSKTLTTGNKEGYALMKDGPIAGGFHWRNFNFSHLEAGYDNKDLPKFYAINTPVGAIKSMLELTKTAGIELAGKTFKPIIDAILHVVDSTSGPNPGTARFVRTLMWYGISKWMDTSWEFRQKPGYAVDANLHTARYFAHQYLLEYGGNGLIYTDEEFDEIMLGYVIKKDDSKVIRYEVQIGSNGQEYTKEYSKDGESFVWVTGKVEGGLIDAFTKKLRDEILAGRDIKIKGENKYADKTITIKDYMLPFGMNSKWPETLANYYIDSARVQEDYKGALNQITPRKRVTRP